MSAAATNGEEPEVLVGVEGRVGRLTLNRPRALHALTTNICQSMTQALLAWENDPAVALVMIDHAGERGFCAGGDIRRLHTAAAHGDDVARAFFFTEYRLNELMFRYAKPIVAVMDGVTMGGGFGISRPARYRIATERTIFAMPETAIGLFPDVGGGWYLPRMPGFIGLWLGLTGARLRAADCLMVGMASDYVESTRLPAFKAAVVADPSHIERLLKDHRGDPGPPPLAAHQAQIADTFSRASVEAIVTALQAESTDWAREQLALIGARSPQAMKVAFRQLALGRDLTFAQTMAMEYALASRVVARPDFAEGVRAALVDKDNAPRWDPPTLQAVTPQLLDELFAALPAEKAWTPIP